MSKPIPANLRRPVTIAAWLAVLLELAELARRLPRMVALAATVGIMFTGAMLVALIAAHWRPLAVFALAYLAIRYGARAQRWYGRHAPGARTPRPTPRRKP